MRNPGIYDFEEIQKAMQRIRKEEGDSMGIDLTQRDQVLNPIGQHNVTSQSGSVPVPPPPPDPTTNNNSRVEPGEYVYP